MEERKEEQVSKEDFKGAINQVVDLAFSRGMEWQRMHNDENASDGYHTFKELYEYRLLYNAAFFNQLVKREACNVVKSTKHHNGERCFGGGWFIVMAELPTGQISNHYEMKDWDLFKCPAVEFAPEWDGHTPRDVAERLREFLEKY